MKKFDKERFVNGVLNVAMGVATSAVGMSVGATVGAVFAHVSGGDVQTGANLGGFVGGVGSAIIYIGTKIEEFTKGLAQEQAKEAQTEQVQATQGEPDWDKIPWHAHDLGTPNTK